MAATSGSRRITADSASRADEATTELYRVMTAGNGHVILTKEEQAGGRVRRRDPVRQYLPGAGKS